MNKVPDTNSVDFGSLEEVRRYAIALREALEGAQDKIDKAWNRSHVLDCGGYIPGALDAWKRPVLQWLPYDFSGNPGASATQYCNGWNDSGGYWKAHADDLSAEVERLRGLKRAARLERSEALHQVSDLKDEVERLRAALEQIAGWQSYTLPLAVDVGSNGVRDFYRNIARAALAGGKEGV